ncbi:MAG: cyclic nucleotide-binding domain-containing protein [Pyrinomonadaceae bacterium]|nr:cyclic nucleotide-binding domain-containing protein [Pyrinomonadaceae bacterium]
MDTAFQAFGWGVVSAISLPLGALLGVVLRPGRKINSAFMAFGAGALLFALTIELFGESIHASSGSGIGILLAMMIGAVVGGLLFDALNHLLNSKGAFARSLSTARRYILSLKRSKTERLVRQLSKIELLASIPPEAIAELIPSLTLEAYRAGDIIFRQGEPGDALYFVASGSISISAFRNGESHEVARMGENDVFGEIALFSNVPRTATARCLEDTQVYRLAHWEFVRLMETEPDLKNKFAHLAKQRVDDLHEKIQSKGSLEWSEAVQERLNKLRLPVSDEYIQSETEKVLTKGHGAAFAIWLGILIDAIPESLVIGMLTKSAAGISFSLIAGVFLANFPEAMSSSKTMSDGGMNTRRIILMWSSLMLITGIGALFGAALFPADPQGEVAFLVAGIRGVAAGAMLTMIAETMLPEAFDQGGAIVGMSTLFGFLTALAVKILV